MTEYIGRRIRHLREDAGLTQQELAKILNISNSTLSQYESDVRTPSDEIKIKIADYFDVSIDYLLGRTDERKLIPYPNFSMLPDEDAKRLKKCLNIATSVDSSKSGDEHSELSKKDKQEIDEYIKDLESNVSGLMFDGQPISDDDKKLLLEQIERTAELIKLRNKEKYTPKKYRKK